MMEIVVKNSYIKKTAKRFSEDIRGFPRIVDVDCAAQSSTLFEFVGQIYARTVLQSKKRSLSL